jgi:Na+/melibiose symporter-like transporter
MTGARPLGRLELAAYGLLNLPLAIGGLPLAIYLPPFYTQEVGLDLSAVGLVLMLARITDVVTDPFIGMLSDRWRSPIGRRRPWVIMGVPIMMLGSWLLFVPPPGAGVGHLLIWSSLLYLGWTMVSIPYSAWGAELSPDYHERTRITGVREAMQLVGLLIATAVPAVLATRTGGKLGPVLEVLALMTCVSLPIAAIALVAFVREARPLPSPHLPLRKALAIVRRNGPFVRLLAATVIGGLASSVNLSLAVLFYTHVMKLPAEAGSLLFFYILIGVVAVPAWLSVAKQTSKHRLLCIAGLWSCFWFAAVPFLPTGQFWPMMILNLLTGLTVAVSPVLGASMAADVVDLDFLRSGKQRAALFFALWAMGAKMANAVGVGVALPLLQLAGFDPTKQNGPDELRWLTVLYVALPIALWLVTIRMLWKFPITPARHARMRARIERRTAAAG